MIRPTLYLGLGGTGKEILLRLRRRLYERFGRSSLPFTSFLWADLDARDVGAQGEELNEVLNRVRFEAHERVTLLDGNIGKDFGNILRDEVQFRQIHQWLYPEVQRYGSGVEDGAGGVRAIGRLAWFKHFSGAIATRIPVALQSIASQGSINDTKAVFESRSLGAPRFDPTPQVVIVCSLAGGTGGGTIVDTLFYLKRLQEMGTLIGGVIPVILLPNVYYEDPLQDWRSKRSYGNAYAALKELEFYSAGVPEGMTQSPDFRVEWQANHKSAIPGPPFSAAYLIETQNEAGVSIPPDDRKELFDSVAASLFLDLMPGEFSDAKRVSHANVAGFMEEAAANTAPAGEKGAVRQEFAKRYGSFGAARVEIPVGTLLRACAARLSEQMCLHLRRSKPMDWLAEVRRDMAARGLDRSGLDKRLGLVWRDSLDREVARIFARPIHNEYDLLALEKDLATASVDLLESRRGTVPAAIKAALSAAKEQVGRDIEEWVLECLNAEERGPKPLVTEQGLIDRFEEEWSRLDAGTDGRAGDLALAAKQADGDAGIWRARCTQIEEELRTAISSFGLTVFAAREGVVEALREQYGEAQKQQWLARADKYRLDATGEFLAAGRERLKSWRSRIKTFLDRLGPWAGGFAEMQLEMLTSPDDNFSIRLHKPGDFETYYRLDNKIVDHGSELVSYLHSLTPQKPTAAGLMALSEGSGEGAAAAHLYAWTEERFHRDAEVNPRPLDMFSYPRLQASQQTREIAERIVKAAQPMLRHQSAPDAQAAQNARECYLGLPDPNDPRCFALRDAIVNQLLSLNYTNPQVLSMGDPSQIFLYTVDYGCTLPMVNLAANECYEAYSAFYSERIANRLQGQPENQIPLHISQEWEDQFPDLIAHSGVEAEKIAAVRRLLLFGVMLNVLDREQGRFSPHYTYLRGRPHFAAEELGNFRDTVELLRTRDDLYNKIHDAVDSRERGLDAEANRALYFACQYLVQSGNLQPSMPEFTYLQRKLTELGGALKVGQASAGQDLQPKGATPKERAAYCLAAAGEALTLKENLPIMVKLEPYSFSDMPSDVCANCKSLVVLDEDHRCSRCGAEFSRFEISLNRYHVEPGDTRAIRLFVANQSSVEMHVRRIDCDRPWLYVPSEPISVEAGRTTKVEDGVT